MPCRKRLRHELSGLPPRPVPPSFQPHEYISLDYSRQDAVRFTVKPPLSIGYAPLPVAKDEPLRLELESFFDCVVSRTPPKVTGEQALSALEVAQDILDKIEEHARLVAKALNVPAKP